MHNRPYEERLSIWRNFRSSLSTSEDPIQDTINFYSSVPIVRMNTDPYDPEMWPNPWELLEENEYCRYCILLGICYTLQLSERFKGTPAEIHIGINQENSDTWYLLHIAGHTIGYEESDEIKKVTAPNTLHLQKIHRIPARH